MMHVIHRYYPPTDCNVSNHVEPDKKEYNMSMQNIFLTYKCIWTPYKIQYYINDVLKHEVINQNYEWFPSLPLHIILSQQVTQPYDLLGQEIAPIAPQTSSFEYVKVKQFFLAPLISGPSAICNTGTMTMDVDSRALNITWQLTPSSLFQTTSGTGKVANVIRNSGATGTGQIIYNFQMPNGETFQASKQISVGSLLVPTITGPVTAKCGYGSYTYKVDDFSASLGESFYWESNILEITDPYAKECTATPVMNGNGYISCTVTACGVSRTGTKNVSAIMCDYLLISPNPSSNETTISIEPTSDESFDTPILWDIEVYDQGLLLKEKKENVKAKKIIINTSGWKDGIYLVKARNGNKIISGKLIVKH